MFLQRLVNWFAGWCVYYFVYYFVTRFVARFVACFVAYVVYCITYWIADHFGDWPGAVRDPRAMTARWNTALRSSAKGLGGLEMAVSSAAWKPEASVCDPARDADLSGRA